MFRQYSAILFLGGLLFFTSVIFAQETSSFEKSQFVQAGDTLPYRLLTPANYDTNKKYPLVLYFHGAGERGNDNEIQIKHLAPLFTDSKNREEFPCFVLAPQCPKGVKWVDTDWGAPKHTQPTSPTRPMQLSVQLLNQIIQTYSIDTTRMYVTGLSMGGFGTWDIITRYPAKFAAAIPICGGADEKQARKIKHLPVWAFHGALDKVVIPERSRNMVAALKKVNSRVKYTEYSNVQHNSWVNAYQEPQLLPWLFAQKKSN